MKNWSNHINDQIANPIRIFKPKNNDEIRGIIKTAEDRGLRVKPVGSGHSWSDLCLCDDFLIDLSKVSMNEDIDTSVLKSNTDHSYLIKLKGGLTIRELNKRLDKKGLALANMGGYDGQTMAGANATSTHGSGISHGPLCDMIHSIDIIASHSIHYRIEPKNGITDKDVFNQKYPNIKLIQNNDWFNSVKVNLGCLGVVISMIIKVTDSKHLIETRRLMSWTQAKDKLKNQNVLNRYEHYELLVNPYITDNNERTTLETIRIPYLRDKLPRNHHRSRNFLVELGSNIVAESDIYKIAFSKPSKSPKTIDNVLKSLFSQFPYINKSYKVYNIGAANHIPSYSAEIALPMENDIYLDALDALFETTDTLGKKYSMYVSGTMAIRFVKKSKAFLSPMYNRNTCMVEILMLKDNPAAKSIYRLLEETMRPFGSKMHWGQFNFLTSSQVISDFPMLPKWKKVAKTLNETKIFNNAFSDRIGLSHS